MINKTAFFKQASTMLTDTGIDNEYNIRQARSLMAQIEKESGIIDWLKNPMISTIISLLTPYIGKNYKVGQALKLLLEALKDTL